MNKPKGTILALFTAQAILIFIGSISKTTAIMSFALSLILAVIIATNVNKKNGATALVGTIWLLVLQNLLIGVGAHIARNTDESLKLMTQVPSFTILISSIFVSVREKNMFKGKSGKAFLALLFFMMISVFFGRGSLLAILINVRNMVTFYCAYLLSKNLITEEDQKRKFYKSLMLCGKIVLVAGIILLICGYNLYRAIGIDEVYIAKGSTLGGGALDDRFYTTIINNQIPRMGSLYYEPVNLAYFYMTTLLMSLFPFDKRDRKIKDILINFIGLILTMGKGAILVCMLCVGFAVVSKIMTTKRKAINGIARLVSILILVAGVMFAIFYYTNIGAASSPHFWAVMRTWNSVMKAPMGHGLGTGGNMSFLFNTGKSSGSYEGAWLSTGGESALMSFMYQVGIPAVLALFIVMYNMSPNKRFRTTTEKVYWFLPISLFAISILQDNTFAPQCIVLPMYIVGMVSVNTETGVTQ